MPAVSFGLCRGGKFWLCHPAFLLMMMLARIGNEELLIKYHRLKKAMIPEIPMIMTPKK